MAEIEVPDFKSIDDFVKWSEGLSEKAIQSWKTDDWLKMYEKIDAYVESDDFYKFYKKAEKRLFDKGKLKTYDPTGAVDIAKRKHLFTNVCSEYIGKIYRNYRFEPEQSKYIREIAKQDGEKLATIQFDAAALAISDSDEAIINKGQTIGNITREGTHYGTTLETGFIDTSFCIDRSSSGAGATPVGRGVGVVRLNPETFVDGNVSVAFHEYAHIYKQARNPLQKELAEKGILAHPELGKNFHKLMEKNGEYYISGKMIQSLIDDLRSTGFSRNKCRVIFNNYHKQPSERYSNLYGAEAERSFRRVSGQLTERGAMDVSSFLGNTVIFQGLDKPPVMLGKPKEAASVEKGICLTYSASDKGVAAEDLLKGVEQRFAGMDEGLKKQLKIQKNMFGDVKITIPNDYSFRQGFLKFRSTPPPVLGIPPLPNGNAEVKIPSVVKEKAAAAVGMQAAAPFEVKTSLENKVSVGAKHLEEKVAAKAGTAAVVNGGEAAGKTTAKKSKVLAKAAAANAKFDKAVDKVIEKGAKKLNNSKVGKAYDKAAGKIGNTKAGKAVGAAAKTVAKKAAGKAVGKVVAKTVGTAVGKSVLKKIPVVSAVAGSYFAYERIKNGEWKAAGCEFLSGVAGCFPGVGTAVSVGLDAGLAANDIHQVVKSAKTNTPKKASVAAPKKKFTAQAKQTNTAKKTVQKTKVSPKQMLALKQNGRA